MAKKSQDTKFDDGLASRDQDKAYGEALLQMGAPKSKTPRRMAKLWFWGFLLLTPLLLGITLIVADNNRSLNAELSEMVKDEYNPSFKVRYETIGAEVVSAWYNKQNPPINVDASIQWSTASTGQLSGATTKEATTTAGTGQLKVTGVSFLRGTLVSTGKDGKRYEERLEYYALINGVPQIIGVTIAIPDLKDITSTPVLVASPTVIGKPVVARIADDKESTPVPQLGAATLNEASKAALNTWAKAWTEDDSSALKATTQDASTDNVYRGLGGGWVYVPNSIEVKWSAIAPKAGGNAVARVTWQMQTPSTTIPATSANAQPQVIPGATQQQSMDVLIGKYEGGSPNILAWGQAGTYMELKPQANALKQEEAAKIPAGTAPSAPAPAVPAPAPAPAAPSIAPSAATAAPEDDQ